MQLLLFPRRSSPTSTDAQQMICE